MMVTITEQCGRCKRTAPLELELSEATALEAEQDERKKKFAEIHRFLNEAKPEDMPGLIVYFKGKIMVIDKVCDTFCAETIKNTLEKVLFRPIDPTARKPREKKETSEKTDESRVQGKKSTKKNAASAT